MIDEMISFDIFSKKWEIIKSINSDNSPSPFLDSIKCTFFEKNKIMFYGKIIL